MQNLGGLTLISPMYFEFGLMLMTKIRELTSQKSLKENQNLCMTHAETVIDGNAVLKEQFLKCDVTTSITKEMKLTIYKQIWKKAMHARAGVEIRRLKEETSNRYAKGGSKLAFRTTLDATSKVTSVAKSIALEAAVMKELKK
jgi:hypothetical protein